MTRFVAGTALLLFNVICAPPASLAKDGEVTADLTARKVLTSTSGPESFESAERARPGEVIEYRVLYTNRGTGAVRGLEGTLPIPEWTEFLPGSASPATFTASLDGKTYAAPPLKRKVKYSDGREEIVEIPWREYRFLRWSLGDLAPGAAAAAAARVRVLSGTKPGGD